MYKLNNIKIKAKVLTTILIVLAYLLLPFLSHNNNSLVSKYTIPFEKNTQLNTQTQNIWQIEIPSINLVAPIAEGIDEENLNKFVGHFEQTSKQEGNIGLAAHNRGYPINYFEKLKDINKDDIIIYKYKNETRKYKIETIKEIKDTNWDYLQQDNESKITLITCIKDKPEKRLCVQGILVEKEQNNEKKQKNNNFIINNFIT